MKSFVLTAYRHGLREMHSYLVGVSSDSIKATQAAEYHCNYRGGLYSVVVEECEVDKSTLEGPKEIYRAKGRNDNPEYRRAYYESIADNRK